MQGDFRLGVHYRFCIFLIPLLFLFGLLPAKASQTDGVLVEWVAAYVGAGHGNDYTLDMTITATDVLFPAGFSFDAVSDDAYLTMKYDTSGTLLWSKRASSTGNDKDHVNAVATDTNGNVCVTGYITGIGGDKNIFTIKYDISGSLEWVRTYIGSGGMEDEGLDIGTDSDDNVFVTGYTQSTSTGFDYVTIKYDSDGTLLWSDVYSGLQNWEDKANVIAVADDGESWVTGGSEGLGAGLDYLTIHYDSSGNRDWVRRYNGPGGGDDIGYDLFLDNGETYITGAAAASTGDTAITTLHYSEEGNQQWVAQYQSPTNDGAVGRQVLVNDDGHIYVTGYAFVGGAGETDYVTLKYDESGDELWHRYYDSPRDPSMDEAAAMSLDPEGNVYVTGYAQGSGGDYDYVTIEYDPDGNNLWTARYDGDEGGSDVATSIAVDSLGHVYVSGYSWGGAAEQYDAVTVKYCRGCLIDDDCYVDGNINPANACLVCDTGDSDTLWSDNDGAACDDGLFCNGDDYCSAGSCAIHSGDPCDDDGLFCNGDEYCEESSDQCLHLGNPCSDDGQYCNGDELCDEDDDLCVHTGDPCSDDGQYCTGDEFCDETNDQCDSTGDPCNDDGVFCNGVESCDEQGDACVSSGDPCNDDGIFCNGIESCDEEENACVSSGDPCNDDDVFCNGVESCDEEGDACISSGDPCSDDGVFCNGEEYCSEQDKLCVSSGDPCSDNGNFCDGDEFCNETDRACGHTGDPCLDGESCDENEDECIPVDDGDDDNDDSADTDSDSDDDEGGDASGGGCCNC